MLVEIAIADAYGAGFEYAPPTPDRPNDATAYVRHARHKKKLPGTYTDDTQCSIAIAECLLAGRTTPLDFASAIHAAFHRDPRLGYARGFRRVLEAAADGPDLLARLIPTSDRSGAAMRAGSVGLLPSVEQVLAVAATQARITHDSPGGTGAAQGAALMVFHQLRGLGPISALPAFLAAHVPDVDWLTPHRGPTGRAGEEIARTALTVLLDSGGLTDVLRLSVDFGGDTDTVASIAMAAASVSSSLRRDLHPALAAGLEDGAFGLRYLRELDRRLAATFDAPAVAAV
jgi:ADP-ribosylglycohydrolase